MYLCPRGNRRLGKNPPASQQNIARLQILPVNQHGEFLAVRQVLGQGPGVRRQPAVCQDDDRSRHLPLEAAQFPHVGLHGQRLPPQGQYQRKAGDHGPSRPEKGPRQNPDHGGQAYGGEKGDNAVL